MLTDLVKIFLTDMAIMKPMKNYIVDQIFKIRAGWRNNPSLQQDASCKD